MKALAVFLAVLALGGMVFAQDGPKASVFAGYQLHSFDSGGSGSRVNFNGFDFDLAGMVKPNFALVGDLSGAYKEGLHVYTFMGGPRITASEGKVIPFAEALFGGTRFSIAGIDGASDTNLSIALGGGIDVSATDKIAVRL